MSPASRTRLEHSTGPNGLGGLDAQGVLGDVLSSFLGGDAAGRPSGGDGGLLSGNGSMLSGSSGIGGLRRGEVDMKSVVEGTRVWVRLDLCGLCITKIRTH